MTRVINMWAAPRNVSTAMMYAWNQRTDTTVVDEPMYAHYLAVTGIDHPGREAVLASQPTDEATIVAQMIHGSYPTPLLFIKNMAHHLEGMDLGFIDQMENFILTRDPVDMLPSLARGLGRTPTMSGTGYGAQVEILDRILRSGRDPIVVDSTTLLKAPESTLESLCDALGITFERAMLSWPAGPKDIDGIWGSHWYKRLHTTTGFEAYTPRANDLVEGLEPLVSLCTPLYRKLSRYAIT